MHLSPHFQALTLLLLTNIFHHVLVLDCDSGTWSGWTECNNCRQTRHLISSSTSPLCEPLADTQLCEECRCEHGPWGEWSTCDCVMNVSHRKRGGDPPLCAETFSAQHCLCDEEISTSALSYSVDKPNSDENHPRQTRGVNDFVINDYHGSSTYRNLCEPSHWNEWGECAGVCGQKGVAVRVRTIESCVEEVDEMACYGECNNFQRLQDLETLENVQALGGMPEGDAANRNVNENSWDEVPTELYSENSVFSGSDNLGVSFNDVTKALTTENNSSVSFSYQNANSDVANEKGIDMDKEKEKNRQREKENTNYKENLNKRKSELEMERNRKRDKKRDQERDWKRDWRRDRVRDQERDKKRDQERDQKKKREKEADRRKDEKQKDCHLNENSETLEDLTGWTSCCDGKTHRYKISRIVDKNDCSPKTIAEKCNDSSSNCDGCLYGRWMDWGKCSKSCGYGVKTKSRSLEEGTSNCNELYEATVCYSQSCDNDKEGDDEYEGDDNKAEEEDDEAKKDDDETERDDKKSEEDHDKADEDDHETEKDDDQADEDGDKSEENDDEAKKDEDEKDEDTTEEDDDRADEVDDDEAEKDDDEAEEDHDNSEETDDELDEDDNEADGDDDEANEDDEEAEEDDNEADKGNGESEEDECKTSSWSDWSDCPDICLFAPASRTRERYIISNSSQAGAECPELVEYEPCFSKCDEDKGCEFTEWSEFNNCEDLCARKLPSELVPSVRTREETRGKTEVCAGKLKQYDIDMAQSASCPFMCEPEPDKTVSAMWGEWNACSPGCLEKRGDKSGTSRKRKVILITSSDTNPLLKEMKPCEKSPPLCKHFKCEVSDWSLWSECSAKCGKGSSQRSRVITGEVTSEQIEKCPRLFETESCNSGECEVVDCQVTMWSEWRVARTARYRKRMVTQQANEHGQRCPKLMEIEKCTPESCSSDCKLGSWMEWSPCSAECTGSGDNFFPATRQRRRQVIMRARKGGKECLDLTQDGLCEPIPPTCSAGCKVSKWSEWYTTSTEPDVTQKRERTVTEPPEEGGEECPDLVQFRDCVAEKCSLDCMYSTWGSWGLCSASCVSALDKAMPTRSRTRRIIQQPENGGNECNELIVDSKECFELEDCKSCEVSNWSDWQSLYSEPDAMQKRERTIIEMPGDGGEECPELVEFRDCSGEECDLECEFTEWSGYGTCSEECISSPTQIPIKTRTREIKTGHKAMCESALLKESKYCSDLANCEKCKETKWSVWGECDKACGVGNKNRFRTVITKSEDCHKQVHKKACIEKQCEGEGQHCEVGLWADWSECQPECGDVRSKTRQRTIVKNVESATCPPAQGNLACETKKCDKCGETEWSEFTVCNCKTKRRTSSRIVLKKKGRGESKKEDCMKQTRRKRCVPKKDDCT